MIAAETFFDLLPIIVQFIDENNIEMVSRNPFNPNDEHRTTSSEMVHFLWIEYKKRFKKK